LRENGEFGQPAAKRQKLCFDLWANLVSDMWVCQLQENTTNLVQLRIDLLAISAKYEHLENMLLSMGRLLNSQQEMLQNMMCV
jgi:hypothetical protein